MANGLFRRLISIAEINDKKETWKIVVQVINMWTIPRSPKCIVELILVDKKVAEIGQWNLHDKPKKVVFTMKDGCGSIMSCTLWESLTLEFKDCFDKHVSGLVVLLLSLAKIKEAKGTYSIAIQNSMYGSQIFVNTDMKEILEFKDRFATLFMILPSMLSFNWFLHNAQVKYFDELSQLKKLLVANGWIYDGCLKCNKKVDVEGSSFVCVGWVIRVQIQLQNDRAVQPNESVILTLWDRECYALIKETANEIKQKMIDELSDDDELIKFVISKLPTLQHQDEVSPSMSTMHEINYVGHSKCLSTTVESDPTLLGSITPAKHILPLSNIQDPDSRVYPPQISAKDVSFQGVLKCGIGGAKTVAQRSSIENTKMIIMQPTPPIVLIEWIKKQKKDLRCKVLAEAEIMHPSLH
ncbi:hypothetical protein JHK82_044630 [Glycine max]|nr:hypothetical protein JHK82_044630 [Glycine max]